MLSENKLGWSVSTKTLVQILQDKNTGIQHTVLFTNITIVSKISKLIT